MASTRNSMSVSALDRVITKFSPAYHPGATPYQKVNFHPKVEAVCTENRTRRAEHRRAKAVLVGDVSVGKTCLLNRFCHDPFSMEYIATVGVDFKVEKFSILSVPVTLQIWDTAGQERFKCIASSYYRGAQIVIVAFDLTDEPSLHNSVKWMKEACVNADEPLKFLVGTKKDLLSDAAYSDIEQRAINYATQLEAEFWATSSKSGENVQDFFFRAMCLLFDDMMLQELESNNSKSRKIGNDLINIKRSQPDLQKRIPCCSNYQSKVAASRD